jgi:hypothetical protein
MAANWQPEPDTLIILATLDANHNAVEYFPKKYFL